MKPEKWMRTSGGTVGKLIAAGGTPRARTYLLEVAGLGRVWVGSGIGKGGRVYPCEPPAPKTSGPTEQRRHHAGSIYSLQRNVFDKWLVSADGTILCGPTSYDLALRAFEAVAPRT